MTTHFQYPSALPSLKTSLPGPKAKAMIDRDHEVLSTSYTRDYPLAVARGLGVGIEDVDGNWFLDFTAGIAVTNTGHCHPRVVQAIQEQAAKVIHMCGTDFYLDPMLVLAERLCKLSPGNFDKRVYFANSGAEAVEAALKLARYHTKRTHIIAFHGAFHGRTMGALSLTASKVQQRRGFAPLLSDIHHAVYNDIASIERILKTVAPPEEVAAIFIEPIQGEGGYITQKDNFLSRVRALCDQHGILMVMDEIQAGFGRTGKMFASEHYGVAGDIMCLAKGLASGMPLGAIVAKKSVMTWKPGNHGSTFGGNPVACAAANATIELLQEDLVENAAARGEQLRAGLASLRQKHKAVGEVRGLGLMIAMDIVDTKGVLAPELRMKLVVEAFNRGLLLLPCGESAIRFIPALCVTAEQVDTAVKIFDEVLSVTKA